MAVDTASDAKKGASLAGLMLGALGLPLALRMLRLIGGMLQFILTAGGLAFLLGFFGYAKMKNSGRAA
jgi:hypothetical protein